MITKVKTKWQNHDRSLYKYTTKKTHTEEDEKHNKNRIGWIKHTRIYFKYIFENDGEYLYKIADNIILFLINVFKIQNENE